MKEDNLYVWQVFDADGRWGTIATVIPAFGSAAPLITRDEKIARSHYGSIARSHGMKVGRRVRLAQFTFARVLES